ncbi:MAG: helix-turn-helix transcriptional regulator [Oscillospiraceae bacterium]
MFTSISVTFVSIIIVTFVSVNTFYTFVSIPLYKSVIICKRRYNMNKIQEFRKLRGLSQAELAEKAGISEISIRKYEKRGAKAKGRNFK